MKEKVKEPKFLVALRIVGICLLLVGITLVVLGVVVFRTNDGFFPNIGMLIPGSFMIAVSVMCFFIGFLPKIQKAMVKTAHYVQDQNKEVLSDIASTSADINKDAIVKSAEAVKEGLSDYKFCKYCGAKIDADSKYCSYCGKEQ